MTGNYEAASHLLCESVEICTASGDKYLLARALNSLGIIKATQGDGVAAEELCRKSWAIRQEIGDRIGQAATLINLGKVASLRRDYKQAKSLYEESLTIQIEMNNPRDVAIALYNLADIVQASGDRAEAKQLLQRSLIIRREIGDVIGSVYTLNGLGEAASLLGEFSEASAYFLEALATALETKAVPLILTAFVGIAVSWYHQGLAEQALELLAFALNQPVLEQAFRDYAEQLRAQIEPRLEAQVAAAAQERGRARQLEEICEEIHIRERRVPQLSAG
jgi:tetratricopeptide (TPR) repeat protein